MEMDVRHRYIQVSMTNFAAMGVQNLDQGGANAPPFAMPRSLDLCGLTAHTRLTIGRGVQGGASLDCIKIRGKTDIMNNVIGRFAHLDPCAIMMIQPTIEMAQDYSKTRISPMIRDTKVLSRIFYDVKENTSQTGAKTRDSNNTILSKIFPGGRLIMCGANSPAGLASRPIRILLADEVDRFPESAGTESDPVDLASKRMTTFWNRVMGMFSTPTLEGSSRIETEYQAGTQEEW